MSRYCGETDARPILNAAEYWRAAALLEQRAVLTGAALWTRSALDELDADFVRRPDEGEGTFLRKLEQQLSGTSKEAKQLAAELMWVMYLCPSSLTVNHKRLTIQTVWSWSDEAFPSSSEWLADPVLRGIGSAGPGFNQNQWRELVFLINLTRSFRALSEGEQRRLVLDPWLFAEWLRGIPDWDARQLRHMLQFLLFPDVFERVFGQNDRKSIVAFYSQRDRRAVRRMDPIMLDRELFAVRQKLQEHHGTDRLDFYVPPLKDEWKSGSFSTLTEGLTDEHVLKAIEEIDKTGVPPEAESTGYDLVHTNKRYPPKLVLSLAVKAATGEPLDRSTFTAGVDSSSFRLLKRLGFTIASKDGVTNVFPQLLERFLAQAQAGTNLSVQEYVEEYRGLRVKVSFGKGNFARIPWIAFLGDGQSVSKGIYPVFLLFREQHQLLLCYGLSEENDPSLSWTTIDAARTVKAWFQQHYGRAPDRYGGSFVRAAYSIEEELPVATMQQDLDGVIDLYERVLEQPSKIDVPVPVDPLAAVVDLRQAAQTFATALRESFVWFGEQHESLVTSFVTSLVTKPFAILTGLSGSGKTQIALRFGEWLGKDRLYVAPVRPDWTGAEALFGYEDALKPAVNGRAAWSVPGPLEFMLRAAGDKSHPYLLLLDEMNLAHVERYFADVLSGMESGQPCLPNLECVEGVWRLRAGEPPRIPFPRNLWIVGTVNVDETTYMFSPKVLDRANTFEFRVESGDLSSTRDKPVPCAPGSQDLVRGLLSIARDDSWHVKRRSELPAVISARLRHVHLVLSRFNMEFGHRVFYEAVRFASLAEEAGLEDQDAVLDRIVIQKILPRVHGSRRRLELPLLALAQFCRDPMEPAATDEKLPTLGVEEVSEPALPQSHGKVLRMLRSLRINQFASFTE